MLELKEQIKNNLKIEGLNVLEINGNWGVGKTYNLDRLNKESKIILNNDIEFKILKLNLENIKEYPLKKILFLEKNEIGNNIKERDIENITGNITEFVSKLKENKGWFKIVGDIADYGTNKIIERETFDNIIVIIDEIERFASEIDFKDFLISIYDLKESEHNIKIILSLNKMKLSENDLNLWNDWSDKLVDKTINYNGSNNFNMFLKEEEIKLNRYLKTENIKIQKKHFNNNIRILKKSLIEIKERITPLIINDEILKFNESELQSYINQICIEVIQNNNPDLIYIKHDFDSIFSIRELISYRRINGFDKLKRDIVIKSGSFIKRSELLDILENVNKSNSDNKIDIEKLIDKYKSEIFSKNTISTLNLYILKENKKLYDNLSKFKENNDLTIIEKIQNKNTKLELIKYLKANPSIINFGLPTSNKNSGNNIFDTLFSLKTNLNIEKEIKELLNLKVKSIENNLDDLKNIKKSDFKMYLLIEVLNIHEQLDFIKRFLNYEKSELIYTQGPIFFTEFKDELSKLFNPNSNPYYDILALDSKEKKDLKNSITSIEKKFDIKNILKILKLKKIEDLVELIFKNLAPNKLDIFIRIYNKEKGMYNNKSLLLYVADYYAKEIHSKKNKKDELIILNKELDLILHSSILNMHENIIGEPEKTYEYAISKETRTANSRKLYNVYFNNYAIEIHENFENYLKQSYKKLI